MEEAAKEEPLADTLQEAAEMSCPVPEEAQPVPPSLEKAEQSVMNVLETMEQKLEESLEEEGPKETPADPEPVVTENVTVTKTESVLVADEDGTPQVTKEVINMVSEKSSELKVRGGAIN